MQYGVSTSRLDFINVMTCFITMLRVATATLTRSPLSPPPKQMMLAAKVRPFSLHPSSSMQIRSGAPVLAIQIGKRLTWVSVSCRYKILLRSRRFFTVRNPPCRLYMWHHYDGTAKNMLRTKQPSTVQRSAQLQ